MEARQKIGEMLFEQYCGDLAVAEAVCGAGVQVVEGVVDAKRATEGAEAEGREHILREEAVLSAGRLGWWAGVLGERDESGRRIALLEAQRSLDNDLTELAEQGTHWGAYLSQQRVRRRHTTLTAQLRTIVKPAPSSSTPYSPSGKVFDRLYPYTESHLQEITCKNKPAVDMMRRRYEGGQRGGGGGGGGGVVSPGGKGGGGGGGVAVDFAALDVFEKLHLLASPQGRAMSPVRDACHTRTCTAKGGSAVGSARRTVHVPTPKAAQSPPGGIAKGMFSSPTALRQVVKVPQRSCCSPKGKGGV